LGAGDDRFQWDPGDGSDVVEGQAGNDAMLFNGSAIGESFAISANGGRTLFTRDIANITMDLNDVENIQFNALGGVDTITVNDLTGTDVKQVNLDLGVNGAGDGSADTVIINATNGADAIFVSSSNGVVTVTGLSETVTISNFDANDRIVINGLGGDDVIEATGLAVGTLTADGGDGDDVIVGGHVVGILRGGAGDDVIIIGTTQDILDGGTGNNVVIPGTFRPASAALLGQFMASTFVPEGNGVVATIDPQVNQPNMLAAPQHA
jgi:Ca2+-binding RTX toxin-like protein